MVSARALPVPASAIVGRGTEVEAILRALETERLVTLTGPPGVGKTRLALAVAERLRDRYDVVAWVDLAPVREPGTVLDEVAHASGVADLAALAERRILLVLDNCEHLLTAGPAVVELLQQLPGVSVLATSRERFRVAAEREHPVVPLPMPTSEDAADLRRLAANPAVALVLERAPAYLDLTPRTALPLVEICRRLDGLPLALEFAAARLRVFTPSELAFRLERRLGELTDGLRDAPAHHRDLRTAMAWSHDLLPEAERAVFRRLSVFRGTWTLAAAEAVCAGPDVPDVMSSVESLLDKSLVRRVPLEVEDEARFAMLMSIREYAAEELERHHEIEGTRRRHLAWFTRTAREWEGTIGTPAESLTWDRVGQVADLEAALDVARVVDPEAGLWVLAALSWFWYTRGAPAQGRDLLPPAEADLAASSADARAAVLVAAGTVLLALGDLDGAERCLLAGQELSRAAGDDRRTAITIAFLGHVERGRGRADTAAGHYREAREYWQRMGNDRGTAWAACDLGQLLADRGEREPAEELLREAMSVFRSLDYPWAEAVAACGLAGVRAVLGDLDEAGRLAGRALALHDDLGDLRGVAQTLEVLAEVSAARRSAAIAARLLGAAEEHRERVAARPTEGERLRVERTMRAVAVALGAGEAARERRAGRSLTRAGTRALVAPLVARAEDPETGVELTGRQLQVARLVAAGRTNRQIAGELGISEKTAELHVRNAMQRLGVQNRAGIAAWVAHVPH
jgi:non-specific serine/threonine protein kinase